MGIDSCAKGCMSVRVPKTLVKRVDEKIKRHKVLRRKKLKNARGMVAKQALEAWLRKH